MLRKKKSRPWLNIGMIEYRYLYQHLFNIPLCSRPRNFVQYKYQLADWTWDFKAAEISWICYYFKKRRICKCDYDRELRTRLNDSPLSKSRGLESGNRSTCIIARSALITSGTRSVYKRAVSNKTKQIVYINPCVIFRDTMKNLHSGAGCGGCTLFHRTN